MNIVRLGVEYFPKKDRSRAISNGYIYVGEPDLDPSIPANQKTLNVQQEDNTIVAVSQPIRTTAGGVPVYNNSPVTLLVDGNYSLLVLNRHMEQEYYVPSLDGGPVIDNLSDYGCNFPAMVSMVGSNPTHVIVDCIPDPLLADLIIPDNITIEWRSGFILTGIATLTMPRSIIAGRYRLFNGPTVRGIKQVFPEWWGAEALGSDETDASVTDSTQAIIAANNCAEYTNFLTERGGQISLDSGNYVVSDTIELSDEVELRGVNTAATRISAQDNANITGGLITNKIKAPIGQEYFFLRDLTLFGNRAQGAVVDTLIYVENVFVNSYIKDVLAFQCSGRALWIVSQTNLGPLYVGNCWFNNTGNDTVVNEGGIDVTFDNCTFENVDANRRLIYLTKGRTGNNSRVYITNPHFEYSNPGVRAIYTDGTYMTLTMPLFIGNAAADQYNVFIDDAVVGANITYYISQVHQAPSALRRGVYTSLLDQEYNTLNNQIITNITPQYIGGYGTFSLGNIETPENTFADGDTTPSVGDAQQSIFRTNNTAITEITALEDMIDGQIVWIFVFDEVTTFRSSGFLRLNGNSFVASTDSMISFICQNETCREISRSLNVDMPVFITDNSTMPNCRGADRIAVQPSMPTNISQFLRVNEGNITVLFIGGNTTLIQNLYLELAGRVDYTPPANTIMTFNISAPNTGVPDTSVAREISRNPSIG